MARKDCREFSLQSYTTMYFLLLLGISAACLTDLASAQCDLQAAMGCLAGFQQLAGSTDMAATCSNFQKAMTCLAPIKENCNSDENFQSSMTALNSVESMCAGGGECTGPLQNCYKDAGIDTTGASMPEPSCEDAKTLQTCLKGLSTVCEGNYAYDQSKTSLQDVVAKCTSAGTQAFPSFVLILVAALMTFVKAF